MWPVYVQVTRCSPAQFLAGLRGQAANENRNEKRSWNSNIPRRWLDGIDFTNRKISNLLYKLMSCKYNPNLFPFCCGLLVHLINIVWSKVNSVLIGNSLPTEFRIVITSPNITAFLEINAKIHLSSIGKLPSNTSCRFKRTKICTNRHVAKWNVCLLSLSYAR